MADELLAVLEIVDDAVDEVIDTELEVLVLYEKLDEEMDALALALAVAGALWEYVAKSVVEVVLPDASPGGMVMGNALELDILAGIGDEGCTGMHLASMVDAEATKDIEMTD